MCSSPKLVTAWLLPCLGQKWVRGRNSKGVSRRKGYCLVRRSSNLHWEGAFREGAMTVNALTSLNALPLTSYPNSA